MNTENSYSEYFVPCVVVVSFRVPLRFVVFCWCLGRSSAIGVRYCKLIYYFLSAFTNVLSVSCWSASMGVWSIPLSLVSGFSCLCVFVCFFFSIVVGRRCPGFSTASTVGNHILLLRSVCVNLFFRFTTVSCNRDTSVHFEQCKDPESLEVGVPFLWTPDFPDQVSEFPELPPLRSEFCHDHTCRRTANVK
jgi:hypothetical protein